MPRFPPARPHPIHDVGSPGWGAEMGRIGIRQGRNRPCGFRRNRMRRCPALVVCLVLATSFPSAPPLSGQMGLSGITRGLSEAVHVAAAPAGGENSTPALGKVVLAEPGLRLARIQGRVVEEGTEIGVEAATIELRGTDRVRISGEGGRFAFDRIPPGDYILAVEHLAFAPVTVPIAITEADAVYQVEIRLAPEAIALEPLVVEVRRAGIQGTVRDRIEWMELVGLGTSFDRAAIDASGAIRVSHLVARIPGVQLRTIPGRTFGSELRLVPQQDCGPSVYIDGIRSPLLGGNVDDMVSLGEVESVEVYRRLSELPGEFADDEARRCGAVVIATRRGWQPGEVFGWRRMVVLAGFVTVSFLLGQGYR